MNDLSFEFNSPMTKEDWEKLADNEMEDTEIVTFKTPSGKRVLFRKVKHGEWERKPDPSGVWDDIPVCSECGCTPKYRQETLFCPNCGADMRGEIQNDM